MIEVLSALLLQIGNPTLDPAVERWMMCVRDESDRFIESAESAETLITAGLGACAEEERRARAAFVRDHGAAGAETLMRRARDVLRETLSARILRRRAAGGPAAISAANEAWAGCIGYRLGQITAEAGRPEDLVDRAMAHCTSEEEALRQVLTAQYAPATVDRLIRDLRANAVETGVNVVVRFRNRR